MRTQIIRLPFYALMISLLFASCKSDEYIDNDTLVAQLNETLEEASQGMGKDYFMLPKSDDLANIPQDPKNPLTAEKVRLGQMLFHETGLAKNPNKDESANTYSCASCHHADAGFQAGVPQGIGEGGSGFGRLGENRIPSQLYAIEDLDIQPIRTPSILNAAYQQVMLWNGQFGAVGLNEGTEASWTEETPKFVNHLGYEGVEIQAIAGFDVHRLQLDLDFIEEYGYKEMFDEVFADIPVSERYTAETTGLAIAAYERTVLANQSRFQKWLRNEIKLTSTEKEGAILFFGKAECDNCHTGPALSSDAFHSIGMKDLNGFGVYGEITDDARTGRGGFTKKPGDMYKFKVPQLYALQQSKFYGHGASMNSVRQMINYKNNGVVENNQIPMSQISPDFKPLNLTDRELQALTLFIEITLDDKYLDRYVPSSLPSGYCFPNNDVDSKTDLGCE